MQNKRFYVRPDDSTDPKIVSELTEAIVAWVMKCKEDYQKRQKEQDGTEEASDVSSLGPGNG
jgi:hypothetical protein